MEEERVTFNPGRRFVFAFIFAWECVHGRSNQGSSDQLLQDGALCWGAETGDLCWQWGVSSYYCLQTVTACKIKQNFVQAFKFCPYPTGMRVYKRNKATFIHLSSFTSNNSTIMLHPHQLFISFSHNRETSVAQPRVTEDHKVTQWALCSLLKSKQLGVGFRNLLRWISSRAVYRYCWAPSVKDI